MFQYFIGYLYCEFLFNGDTLKSEKNLQLTFLNQRTFPALHIRLQIKLCQVNYIGPRPEKHLIRLANFEIFFALKVQYEVMNSGFPPTFCVYSFQPIMCHCEDSLLFKIF